jgi:hypothetical protein
MDEQERVRQAIRHVHNRVRRDHVEMENEIAKAAISAYRAHLEEQGSVVVPLNKLKWLIRVLDGNPNITVAIFALEAMIEAAEKETG